ncbi:MAG: enoyl-CoA hydratase/isomerase family protein [Phycisphaerales bacterium]|nr:enoyl-CoA hydratase/isomerase family protein [Phycisphaerales bacterium]
MTSSSTSAGLMPLRVEHEASGPFAGVATLWLEQPGKPVVVLDLELIQRLEAALKAMPRDLIGLVVASASSKVFVAGADLKSIQTHSDSDLLRYLRYGSDVFGRLSKLPFPTAAAINGAALGGGLELAMHCDALVGAPGPKPYPVGLPEAGLKICPGWGGTNLLPARIAPIEAIRRTAGGRTMLFDEAAGMGLFDAVAPAPDALLGVARRWVKDAAMNRRTSRDGMPSRWIGRPGVSAAARRAAAVLRGEIGDADPGTSVLRAVETGLAKGWHAALNDEQAALTRLRNEPAGKQAIAAFFEKK